MEEMSSTESSVNLYHIIRCHRPNIENFKTYLKPIINFSTMTISIWALSSNGVQPAKNASAVNVSIIDWALDAYESSPTYSKVFMKFANN